MDTGENGDSFFAFSVKGRLIITLIVFLPDVLVADVNIFNPELKILLEV